MDMIFVTQPWMIATLTPLVLAVEVVPLLRGDLILMTESHGAAELTFFVLVGSSLAFLMELSEYLLLSYTSSLTLSISCILKVSNFVSNAILLTCLCLRQEMITIGLSYQINNDSMSTLNFLGFLVCMSGIVLHVYVKVKDVSRECSCTTDEQHVCKLIRSRCTTVGRAAANMDESEVQQLMHEDADDVPQVQKTEKEAAVTFHKEY